MWGASPAEGALSIPSTLGGCPVTTIGYGAFSGCDGLTSVTIPGSVGWIEGEAFRACGGITSAVIQDGVYYIGYSAFAQCDGLTEVTIPDSVAIGGDSAFANCGSLAAVSVPHHLRDVAGEWGFSDECEVTVREPGPLAVATPAALPGALAWEEYWQEVCAVGGEGPYTWEVVDEDEWPSWLDRDYIDHWAGWDYPWLNGRPYDEDAGTNEFTLRVTDAAGASAERTFRLVVEENPNPRPVIDSRVPEVRFFRASTGTERTFSVEAHDPKGDELAYSWHVYDDDWATIHEVGDDKGEAAFTWTFGEPGTYHVEVEVSDGAQYAWTGWEVLAAEAAPLAIATEAELPAALTEEQYMQALEATGGDEPYAWEIVGDGEWPEWLSRDAIVDFLHCGYDGPCLQGWPSEEDIGTNVFTLRVTDAAGRSAERTFALAVEENPNSAPVIDSREPEDGSFRVDPGTEQTFSVEAHDPDGDELAYFWSVWDGDDNEIHSSGEGGDGPEFTWTFEETGSYYVGVTVSDGSRSAWEGWSVQAAEAEPLAIATEAELPAAEAGERYWLKLEATGGEEPYAWEIVDGDKWPAWLELDDSGALDGGPTDGDIGSHEFALRVTDAAGASAERTFTLAVVEVSNPRPVIDSREPEEDSWFSLRVELGAAQTFSVVAHDPNGDELAYYWTVEDPGGNRVYRSGDGGEGAEFTWTFGEAGSHWVEVEVSDGEKTAWTAWYVKVAKPRVAVTTEGLPAGTVGAAYTAALEATGGTPPYTWSVGPGRYGESAQGGTFAAAGTAQGWQADDECWDLALPFAFPFFGGSHTNAKINANGAILFVEGDPGSVWFDEESFAATPCIVAMWEDLTTLNGDVYVASGPDSVTVRWEGEYYGSWHEGIYQPGAPANFAATLCKDGRIVLSYGEGNEDGGIVGLSAGDGATAGRVASGARTTSCSRPKRRGSRRGWSFRRTGRFRGRRRRAANGFWALWRRTRKGGRRGRTWRWRLRESKRSSSRGTAGNRGGRRTNTRWGGPTGSFRRRHGRGIRLRGGGRRRTGGRR